MSDTDWQIDLQQQQARHLRSGLVLRVTARNGDQFSVQPILSTLPTVVGEPDLEQVQALHREIQRRVQEGGAILVKAVAAAAGTA